MSMSINGLGPSNFLLSAENSRKSNLETVRSETKSEVHVGSLGLGTALAVAYDLCENITAHNQMNITPTFYTPNSHITGFLSLSTMKSPIQQNGSYGSNNFLTSCSPSNVNSWTSYQANGYLTPITAGFLSPQKSFPKFVASSYPNANAISMHKMSPVTQIIQSNNCTNKYDYNNNHESKDNNIFNVNNGLISTHPSSKSIFNGTASNDFMANSHLIATQPAQFALTNETTDDSNSFPMILNENTENFYNLTHISKLNTHNNSNNNNSNSSNNSSIDGPSFLTNGSVPFANNYNNTFDTNTKSNSDSPPNSTDESMYELSDEEMKEIDNRLYSNEDVIASRQWKYYVETNEWTRATCALMACLFTRDQMANSTVLGRGGSQRARLPMNLVAYVVTTIRRRFNKPAAAIRARMAQKCKDERRFGRSPMPPSPDGLDNGMITGQSPVAAITTKHNPRKVRKRPYAARSPMKNNGGIAMSSTFSVAAASIKQSKYLNSSNLSIPDFSNMSQFSGGNYSIEDGTSSSATDSNQLPPINLSPLGTGSGLGCSSDLFDSHNSFDHNNNNNVSSTSYFYAYDSSVCLSPSSISGSSVTVVPTPLIFNHHPTPADKLILFDTVSATNTNQISTNAINVSVHDYDYHHHQDHINVSMSSSSSSMTTNLSSTSHIPIPSSLSSSSLVSSSSTTSPTFIWNNSLSGQINGENKMISYSLSCV